MMGAEAELREILEFPVDEAVPPIDAVLSSQGIPRWVKPDERTTQLAREALALYRRRSRPRGVLLEVTREDFRAVFAGEGLNDQESPVNPISGMADDLVLFAVTIGGDVSLEITALFDNSDFALASMLDAAASEGTEMTAQAVENIYRRRLQERGRFNTKQGILRFSPGYCGWHITGQRRLFPALQPGSIGITLNDSCLMQPIKSITGVIISGRREIFDFEDVFAFCRDCMTHTCRERIRALYDE